MLNRLSQPDSFGGPQRRRRAGRARLRLVVPALSARVSNPIFTGAARAAMAQARSARSAPDGVAGADVGAVDATPWCKAASLQCAARRSRASTRQRRGAAAHRRRRASARRGGAHDRACCKYAGRRRRRWSRRVWRPVATVRKKAAWALGEIGRARRRRRRRRCRPRPANDQSPLVRSLAKAALTKLQHSSAFAVPLATRGGSGAQIRRSGLIQSQPPHAFLVASGQRRDWRASVGVAALGGRVSAAARSSTPRRAALLRRPHPADPQHLLRRQHLALPQLALDRRRADALGNLDLSSFDAVQKRRDVLRTYGSYPQPLLLLKALPAWSRSRSPISRHVLPERDPAHAAARRSRRHPTRTSSSRTGSTTAPTATARCPRLVANHGQRRLQRRRSRRRASRSPVDTTTRRTRTSSNDVQPMIEPSCAFGTCHSSPQSDFYITCGDGDDAASSSTSRRRPASSSADRRSTRRAERDPAAPAGARGRRRQPHGRRLLPVARPTRPGWSGRRGPRRSRRTPPLLRPKSDGAAVLRGERHAQAARSAAARSRGATAPTGSTTSGCARARRASSRRPRSPATTTRAGRRVHGPRHRRRQAVARGEEEHPGQLGRHHPPRGADARGLRAPSRRRRRARSRSTPADPTPRAFCVVQGWHAVERQDRIAAGASRR